MGATYFASDHSGKETRHLGMNNKENNVFSGLFTYFGNDAKAELMAKFYTAFALFYFGSLYYYLQLK